MKQPIIFILIGILLAIFSEITVAHKASDSYLRFEINDGIIQGRWDIALRDLDYAIGLDEDADRRITWGELRVRHQAITNYAFTHLQIRGDGAKCWSNLPDHLVDHHTDGAYAVLHFTVTCPETVSIFEIEYSLLFDLDLLHRGLLQVAYDEQVQTGIFSPEHQTIRLNLNKSSSWHEFIQFGREGVWHIWIGYDHILFLISLLLPAVLQWKAGRWYPQQSFRLAFWEVFKIVTAFTLAHSITLSLAVLGFVSLPSRWVESAIAASVLIVALHNLYPIIQTRLWVITFIFGLIHGLGFASVLIDFDLPQKSLALALAGFNLGVEIGQVVIVGIFTPLAFWVRRSWFYQRFILNFGSLMIAFVAFIWLIERSMTWT
ncbi:HupE/UreJ family protein [Nitrosomonas sp. Nm166]|uniref:HupE/UreJ family protein n=1 Tax=Nitrosomonas sp. Nm166 TaxID=1881054 RepID=UPI0008E804B0|nr:HupE/UreJ family protein [Nitrosomonas sp. Nm166]SFE23568.1 HupE / UreJ protein [Nitrosomonas sp. Nm166]